MGKAYFVGGIGTDVGKTVATGLMARYLLKRNVNVTTMKLVQTGCEGRSEDILRHRELGAMVETPEDRLSLTAPQVFRYPSSPALAAALEGKTVDVDAIERALEYISARYETVLVEAAGGLAAPLTDDMLMIDFAAKHEMPLILVANSALGSINHTILSLEAAANRNVHLAGVVMNKYPAAPKELEADAKATLSKTLERLGYEERISVLPLLSAGEEAQFAEIFK